MYGTLVLLIYIIKYFEEVAKEQRVVEVKNNFRRKLFLTSFPASST
jgi:hypothetical protein